MTSEQPSHPSLQELARQAAAVAANSHLESIALQSIEATLLAKEAKDPAAVKISSRHAVEHQLERGGEGEPSKLLVLVRFELRVAEGDNEPADTVEEQVELFRLKATFAASYALNRGMPDEAVGSIDAFARTNTMIHVWPYYRELVQSTTWRMGLPPFPMPLFRVTDQRS
jgi:hypothetical protein